MSEDQDKKPEEILTGSVKEVSAAIQKVEDLDALKTAEEAGQKRAGVLKAIEAEIAKRAAALKKDAEEVIFVLEKNFGYIEAGVHHFIEAGREFVEKEESALISKLHRLGAAITRKD